MIKNRCKECGYRFGSDVPDYIIEKCWECRFKESYRSEPTKPETMRQP